MADNFHKKEIGISIVKAAFSNIPFAGQLLTEVLFEYRGRIKQNRLNMFTEMLSQYFSENSEVVIENMRSEDFSDLLELVLRKVVDTKSEEKLRRFKDILVNSIVTDIDYNNSERYLDLVSSLTETDIQILKRHELFDSSFEDRFDYQKINQKLLGDLEENMNEEIKLRDEGYANNWQRAVSQFNAVKASMRTFEEQNKSVEIFRNAEFYGIENSEFLYSKQKLFSLGLLIDSGAGKYDYKPFHMMSITEFAKKFLEFIKK